MPSRHEKEAARQDYAEKARLAWMKLRVERVHSKVSAYDVMRSNGVELKQMSDGQEEQFSCPFHGEDNKPSARIYPESHRSPSHAWCFVCQERWDAISLWAKFNGGEDKKFSQIISEIERAYGLETPEVPKEAIFDEKARDDEAALERFLKLHAVCESRLLEARAAYEEDMVGYLQVGSVLDKIGYRVDQKTVGVNKGLEVLRQVLDRIGQVERATGNQWRGE